MASYRIIRAAALLTGTVILSVGASSAARQNAQPTDYQSLIRRCKASDSTFTDAECATQVKRADYVRKTSCPDSDASAACTSFRELVEDNDSDIMSDLAIRTNVYICFRQKEDVFIDVYFSDPNDGIWERDGDHPGMAFVFGGAAALYYKGGIGSRDMSFPQDLGKWQYSGLTKTTDVYSLRVPFNDAIFQSDDIFIQGSRFHATKAYKNVAGADTQHTLILQLSTGRFLETYNVQPSGEVAATYSGRCIMLPVAVN